MRDNRFSVLDWMSEKAFFFANNFDNIADLLPTYKLSNDINWKLYYRSYIDFKINCRYLIVLMNSPTNFLIIYLKIWKVQSIRDINIVLFFNVDLIVLDIVLWIFSYFFCQSNDDESNKDSLNQLDSQKQYNTLDANQQVSYNVEMDYKEDFPSNQLQLEPAAQDVFLKTKIFWRTNQKVNF